MTSPFDLDDDPLAQQLRDLGPHLDLGRAGTAAGAAALVRAVVAALPADAPEQVPPAGRAPGGGGGDRRRSRWLAVAAAVALVVGLSVAAVAPAREAVARWLGIGAVRIERTDEPGPRTSTPVDSLPAPPTLPGGAVDLDALVGSLPFAVRLPGAGIAGEPKGAAADPAVPSGLIEVRYPSFTLVALASEPGSAPVLSKTLGPGTDTVPVVVGASDGLWITGDPHEVAFLDPDGTYQLDRVRGAGDVLLWEDDGVTYRIEGAPSLDRALAIAASLR